MKNKFKLAIATIFVCSVVGCNEYTIFEGELYKKQIYIVSNDENIFPIEYTFGSDTTVAYFSIAYGGTENIAKNVFVEFQENDSIFNRYNYSHFDIEEEKYAIWLDRSKYAIPEFSATLSATDKNPYIAVPIEINPEDLVGLSPDSTYLIPLILTSVSDYEMNPLKKSVLCQIHYKNKYAATKTDVYYAMKGTSKEQGNAEMPVGTTKILKPLSKNSVRLFAGSNTAKADAEYIRQTCIKVVVNDDFSLSVFPYNSEWMEAEIITPDADPDFIYRNVYNVADKRFLIYYKYRFKDNDTGNWSNWFEVKESLKLMDNDDLI